MKKTLAAGLLAAIVFPLTCCSGLEKVRSSEILNAIARLDPEYRAQQDGQSHVSYSGLSGLEDAFILKGFDGERVLIERANGEQWMLESYSWCSWSWLYEGQFVLLKFGYTSSKLINSDGDLCEFWTEEQVQ